MRRIKILKIYFIFILFLVFLVFSNIQLITTFFMATLTFNIAILTIFSIGLLILYQAAIKLTMLSGTFGILAYKKGKALEFYLNGITGIFPATIAHMFNKRAKKGVLYFTQNEAKDVSEWLGEQFFNQKGYTNFFVGTSLMLGLFGTFTGLLVAIDEMGAIILSFGGDDIDIGEVMTKFSGPLGGMSIGFASSLFGVASAVILNVMQYILTRNQAAFMHDVEDWMKGKIIETQSSEMLESLQGADLAGLRTTSRTSSEQGLLSAGFLDVFIDTMGDFTEKLDKSNKASEDLHKLISQNIAQASRTSEKESVLLESIVNNLRELNVNQFSNASMMEESLQEISNVILAEHRSVKKNLALQEENNKLLKELINRIEKLEINDKK
ncbi:hypothetical protein [Halarcobacter bivalviorum]|uniref:Membrane protein n=1 Tax=Halarcobacter bivalviorum TaxID=663364 RepID=A0AAX2AB14_9BACT|nr:hypothetical protein [Halarcobacter bivalviorum]AXH11999.1 putative membrane protein [Halarcobacter bivalviorum]RXK11115.1 hypothetical protein CRV05_01740 [Halarcobacter bivalviorum]